MNRRQVAATATVGFAFGAFAGTNIGDAWVFWCLVLAGAMVVLGIMFASFGDGR